MSAPLPPLAIAPPSAPTAAPPRAPMRAPFAVSVILSFLLRTGPPWAAATRLHSATADWDGTPVRAGADVAGAGVAGWAAGVVGAWATVAEGDGDDGGDHETDRRRLPQVTSVLGHGGILLSPSSSRHASDFSCRRGRARRS